MSYLKTFFTVIFSIFALQIGSVEANYCGRKITADHFKGTKTKKVVTYILKAIKDLETYAVDDPRYTFPFRYYSSFNCDRGRIEISALCDDEGKIVGNPTLSIEFLGLDDSDRGDIFVKLDTEKDSDDVKTMISLAGRKMSINYKDKGYIDDYGFPHFSTHVVYDIELNRDDQLTKLDFTRYYKTSTAKNSCIRSF
jgi:hypothetical protein